MFREGVEATGMGASVKAGDPVKYSKPDKGEEGFIFRVIEGPYENGRVHILCLNSGLPIPNVEVVSKEDIILSTNSNQTAIYSHKEKEDE